jgi:hypothetical protein
LSSGTDDGAAGGAGARNKKRLFTHECEEKIQMHSPYRTRNTARYGLRCDRKWTDHIEKLAVSTDVHVAEYTIGTGASEDAVF